MNRSTWPLTAIVAASLGILGAVSGCRVLPKKTAEQAKAEVAKSSAPNAGSFDSGVVKSDFRADVAADQQVQVHLDLARGLESQGSFEAAAMEYQKAIESIEHPAQKSGGKVPAELKALANRRMAAAYDRLGRFAQAETHYKEALRLSPKDARVWNDAGYSSYLQGKWSEGETRLKTAARIAPDDPRIQTNLGLCLAASGKTEPALEALTRAAGPAIAHANLGYILAASGKPVEARQHYEKALTLQPELVAARTAIAQLDKPAAAATAIAASRPPATADPAVVPVARQTTGTTGSNPGNIRQPTPPASPAPRR